jgi:hypothetical protein
VRSIVPSHVEPGRNGRRAWLRLSLSVLMLFCLVPPAGADIYKCARSDGSTVYSGTPCDPDAERIQAQATSGQSSPTQPEPVIQSAAYVSPRNGRELDVTSQLNSMCLSGPDSCTLRCGNQLAGDPDFGQRKYCRISFRCSGGSTQEVRIQEGQNLRLSCPRRGALAAATPGTAPRVLPGAGAGPSIRFAAQANEVTPSPEAALGGGTPTPAQARLARQLFKALGPVTTATAAPSDWARGAKLAAAPLVQALDPNNPKWGPTHPKWNAMLTLVAGDVAGDFQSESHQWTAQIGQAMVEHLAQRLTSQDLGELTQYFSGAAGKRYLAFQAEITPLEAKTMQGALLRDPAPPPSATPSQSIIKQRMRLLLLSTTSQVTQAWFDQAQRAHGDTSGFGAYGFMAAATAVSQGAALDAIGERYSADLDAFESFNKTPLAHRYYAAFGSATLSATPVMQSVMKTFDQTEQARYGERWKSAYMTTVVEPAR